MRLRRAVEADSNRFLAWVNARDSLAWKQRSRNPIPRSIHEEWFKARLADPDTDIWVIEAAGGAPAGQLRMQREGDLFAVDIYVDPGYRQKGIAAKALMEGLRRCRQQRGAVDILAVVHDGNRSSQTLFERCGFSLLKADNGWRRYILSAGTTGRGSRQA